ncbi:exonuclease domain-containing protein [Roseivirga pacifica]|uniref:exonuclease domain-containing protein n=1 Tax=Roseivirga pacifica TaxID=1267423 RepID=UPI00227B77B8|nr:exonuclease domain-containing protein [Roseivirga pacifica]
MFAIVDIETTGSAANYGKITEVAILVHDGQRVVDEYQSLINPERGIPPGITALTGISNEMVADAPRFYEVAKEIHMMLEGNIFVAHNVNFDYSFLKKEFEELGAEFKHKKLCSVRLSRKVFPGLRSYSLGKLCDHFGIANHARHRAMGDAKATAELMDLILENESGEIEYFLKKNSKEADLPPNLDKQVFENLPDQTGVYYFHDEHGKVLYVGKANNIKKRIRGHFSSTDVIYKQGMKDKIFDISFELCGDELVAFLFEAYEIRRLFPPFNKAQKYPASRYGLYHYQDAKGNHRLSIGKAQKGLKPLAKFTSFDKARTFLIQLVREYELDPELCSLPADAMKFFGYSFKSIGEDEVNARFSKALEGLNAKPDSFVIMGQGRTIDEQSIVYVEEGVYKGFGFVADDIALSNNASAKEFITNYPDTPETQRIINQFKEKRRVLKMN